MQKTDDEYKERVVLIKKVSVF